MIANDGGTFHCCGRDWHFCGEFGKVREGRAHLGRPHPEKSQKGIYHECSKCGKGHQSDDFVCCRRNFHFSRSEDRLIKEKY
jgi:hypothetical protein